MSLSERLLIQSAAGAVATTAVASAISKAETGCAAAAINATSHIIWGECAFQKDDVDLKHTVVGALLNAGAMLSWSTVYQLLPNARSTWGKAAKAAAVTASAYVTDYYVVPKRLTPGFEARLSARGLALVYASLWLGFLASDAAIDPR